MENKNKSVALSANLYKSGYFRASRSLLKQFFSADKTKRQEAHVLLCIHTHAYFSSGTVMIGDNIYPFRRGEWLTTTLEIAEYTSLTRGQVKWYLKRLVTQGHIETMKIKNNVRIVVTNYDQISPNSLSPSEPPSGNPRVQAPAALPPSEPQQPDEEKKERSDGYNFLDHLNNLMK